MRINTHIARDSQTNALATATIATPGSALRWRILKVSATYTGSGPEGVLQILSGASVLWELGVDPNGGVLEDFIAAGGLQCNANQAAAATLSAGGVGVVGRVNLLVALEQ